MMTPFSATVFSLNVATVVTFATLPCTLQQLLQCPTQVLTVIMVSHMFLNLKGRDNHVSRDAESRGTRSNNRSYPFGTTISLETRVKESEKMSNALVGNLGNDLIRTSMLDYWTADEKVGQWAFFFLLLSCIPDVLSASQLQPYSRTSLPINQGIGRNRLCTCNSNIMGRSELILCQNIIVKRPDTQFCASSTYPHLVVHNLCHMEN